MLIQKIGYVHDCELDRIRVFRGLIELHVLINLWFEMTLGRWCKKGARIVELAYIVAVYAHVWCVNTLGGLKIMCLKHGTDRDKLNMLGERGYLRD